MHSYYYSRILIHQNHTFTSKKLIKLLITTDIFNITIYITATELLIDAISLIQMLRSWAPISTWLPELVINLIAVVLLLEIVIIIIIILLIATLLALRLTFYFVTTAHLLLPPLGAIQTIIFLCIYSEVWIPYLNCSWRYWGPLYAHD